MCRRSKIKNIIEGDGIEIVNHSKIQVHYIGKLEDGSKLVVVMTGVSH